MPKQIEIIVDPQGGVTVKAIGYTGRTCKDATKFLEQALGTVTKDTATPEMYQTETVKRQVTQ